MSSTDARPTMRERFDKRKRVVWAAVLVGCMLLFAGALSQRGMLNGVAAEWLVYPGVAMFLLATAYGNFWAFLCIRCGRNCAGIAWEGTIARVDPRFRLCPFCGQSLDA